MTASEFAFLALGLVLGVASGAALIEILRARPPAARHIRVTVAPNAIQARRAATLAEASTVADHDGPAEAGPGDRRWREPDDPQVTPPGGGRRIEDQLRTPVRSLEIGGERAEPRSPGPFVLQPAARAERPSLAPVPMSLEPDPAHQALTGPPAVRLGGTSTSAFGTGRAAPAAVLDRVGVATGSAAEPEPSTSHVEAGAAMAPTPIADGPCAEERRVADERCAVATRARDGATAAATALRDAQRRYDELVNRADAAADAADPRAIRAAKEEAQQAFRDARARAKTRDDVEAGARIWLAQINQINHDTREAAVRIQRDRAAAATIGATLERLAVESDAARISAERADEACVAARDAVAACDEARTLEAAAARASTVADPIEAPRIAPATPQPEDEFGFASPMHSQADEDAVIIRILRGDREAMQRAVARLAGDDPDAQRRWQLQLGALAEALIARSIEASAFDFPIEHPFWGPFSQTQNRDIASGLSSLGFHFDGFGGWTDDRIPSQRDLSLAVGYAGLDPMRIRHWPTESETRELLSEVRVAADEYIAGAAGGMTLGELVSLLGRRADALTELWNDWGAVRPILLEAS